MESPRSSREIPRKLLRWFNSHKRMFPWRETFENPDPYVILFTELMLLRTKADQVSPVYQEFLANYPTFERLSEAPKKDIIALFSSLGLKWRTDRIMELIEVLKQREEYSSDCYHPSPKSDIQSPTT